MTEIRNTTLSSPRNGSVYQAEALSLMGSPGNRNNYYYHATYYIYLLLSKLASGISFAAFKDKIRAAHVAGLRS